MSDELIIKLKMGNVELTERIDLIHILAHEYGDTIVRIVATRHGEELEDGIALYLSIDTAVRLLNEISNAVMELEKKGDKEKIKRLQKITQKRLKGD